MIRWATKALDATAAALLASLGLAAAPSAALLWYARIVSVMDGGAVRSPAGTNSGPAGWRSCDKGEIGKGVSPVLSRRDSPQTRGISVRARRNVPDDPSTNSGALSTDFRHRRQGKRA